MKKIVKISILMFIIGLCFSIKSFAAAPYLVEFSAQDAVEMGATIEVPLVIKNINPDDTAKYVSSVKCTISCDENAFEILGFNINSTNANGDYSMYNEDNKKVSFIPKSDLKEITEIGKATIKVKNNIPEGNYNLIVQDIEAGNGNELLTIADATTPIYVNGIKEETEENEEGIPQTDVPVENGVKVVENEFKKLVLKIQMKKDGTELVITPDEENGGKVGMIKVNNKEVERKDGKYVVKTEPNTFYKIDAYDVNGNFASSRSIITTVEGKSEEDADNAEDEKNSEIDENNTDTDKKSDENKDTNTSKEDVKKSPQTGDSIYTAIALLVVATCAWVIAYGVKFVKE